MSEQSSFPLIQTGTGQEASAPDDAPHRAELASAVGPGTPVDPLTGRQQGVRLEDHPDRPPDAGPMWLQHVEERGAEQASETTERPRARRA